MQPVYFHVSQSYACWRVVSLNLMTEFSTVLICLSLHCRKTKYPDLHKWFCVDTIKVCCPKGTFGPDCNGNVDSRKYCQEPVTKWLLSEVLVPSAWSSPSKIVWEAPTDPVTEMECVTATGLVAETASAPAATATRGSSVWTASTASSATWGTTPSLCAQVCLKADTACFHCHLIWQSVLVFLLLQAQQIVRLEKQLPWWTCVEHVQWEWINK